MDKKSFHVDDKSAQWAIPVPITHRPAVTSPRKKWGRRLALLFVFLCTVHFLSDVKRPRHNGHDGQDHGMLDALMRHAPKKGSVLRGKKAEQLFLYVLLLSQIYMEESDIGQVCTRYRQCHHCVSSLCGQGPYGREPR